ncbi:MAG TPA: 2'-5' RNA ligase family protein [Acidimicrobiales bacterium]|nr:2'-5' RNA ligase family protein [Acidimicrobiales bacterium]
MADQLDLLDPLQSQEILDAVRVLARSDASKMVLDALTASSADPSDGMPDIDPVEVNLREAGVGAVDYCGKCRFWQPPGELADSEFVTGTCAIVTGDIDYQDVCDLYEERVTAGDGELPEAAGTQIPNPGDGMGEPDDDGDGPTPGGEVDGPAPTIEGDNASTVAEVFGDEFWREYQEEDEHGGVIVTVEPTPEQKQALEQPGGMPADQLHLTLAKIDGVDNDAAATEVLGVLLELAAEYPAFSGEVAGTGALGERQWGVALVDAEDLGLLRSEVIEALVDAGIMVSDDHDFIPHITLTEGPIPADAAIVGLPLTFDSLVLRVGSQVIAVGMDGPAPADEVDVEEEPVAPTMTEPEAPEDAPMEPAPAEGEAATMSIDDRQERIRRALRQMSLDDREMLRSQLEVPADEPMVAAGTDAELVEDSGAPPPEVAPVEEPAEADTDGEEIAELETEVFGAIAPHDTPTSDDAWDGPENDVRVSSPNDPDYFDAVYAWRDDDGDLDVKAAYRFIHHFVSESGDPGAASTVACSTGIGVLNGGRGGTTIPGDDRQGVYDHLAAHLRDADMEPPELMSDEEAALVARAHESGVQINPADPDSVRSALEHTILADEAEAALAKAEEADVVDLTDIEDSALLTELARRVLLEAADGVAAAEAAEGDDTAAEGVEMAEDGDAPEVEPEVEDVVVGEFDDGDQDYDWTGIIIVEGLPSGDGRMVAEGGLTWRELPLPLMLQTVNAPGHEGSEIAGSIHKLERRGQDILGWGKFDSGKAGTEYRRLLTEKTMRGVSADIDSVKVEFRDPESGDSIDPADLLFGDPMMEVMEVLTEGRIMGATGTPFPAFQEAHIELIGAAIEDEALVASAAWITETTGNAFALAGDGYRVYTPIEQAPWVLRGEEPVSLVASAGESPELEIPMHPSLEWFAPTNTVEPFTVHADGRITGLLAKFGTCHIGRSDRCIPVPTSRDGYSHFRNKKVLSAEGELVATGPIFMDTVHPDLKLKASDTEAHYHDTGCAVADVAVYDTDHGIEVCGALRPDVTEEQIRRLRGSDISPDWRKMAGRLEMVGLLAVNVSGFVVQGLVAAGAHATPRAAGYYDTVTGECESLVAAGMVLQDRPVEPIDIDATVRELQAEVAELREAMRPIRAERATAKFTERVFAELAEDVEAVQAEVAEGDPLEDVTEAPAECECHKLR